ncbi:hypothetical protein ABZY93_06995 [Streptomyces smyrnaeus]|uniref:hypothetical protein n=1 Tax=Streptomyces smyrnaeus TaxID=1387713 RepID=UPI0033A8B868
MYSNALDTFVRSVKHGKEIMIIHRVTGGYLTQSGDLQIATDPLEGITDKKHLWVVHLDGYIKNNTVFSLENKSSGNRLTANDKNPREGMTFTEAQEPGATGKAADAQRFFVLPLSCGGYSLVPVLWPEYCLGPKDNHPQPGCDRPVLHFGNDSSLNCSHDFVLPPTGPPRRDPTDTNLDAAGDSGQSGGSEAGAPAPRRASDRAWKTAVTPVVWDR